MLQVPSVIITVMSPSFADDITPVGAQNALNRVFTLPEAPNPTVSLQLPLNGVLQTPGVDYTLVGNVITYIHASPLSSDIQLAFFRYAGVVPPVPPPPPSGVVTLIPTLVTPVGSYSRDDYSTLSRRLLNRAPEVGIVLARQFINDSWRTLQAMRA